MEKDRSINLRNSLNSLIATLNGNTQEDEIMRCALSEAVESLERWIYDGNYTPSVRPADKIFTIKTEIHSGDKLLTDDRLRDKYLKGRSRVSAIIELEKDFGITQEKALRIVDEYERTATPFLNDDEKRSAREGRKVEAIRMLKLRTCIGLKRAKDLIEDYQESIIPSSTPAPTSAPATTEIELTKLVSEVTPEEIELCKKGRKIEAIRDYRSRTGCGLVDSKNAIEEAFKKATGMDWVKWYTLHKHEWESEE